MSAKNKLIIISEEVVKQTDTQFGVLTTLSSMEKGEVKDGTLGLMSLLNDASEWVKKGSPAFGKAILGLDIINNINKAVVEWDRDGEISPSTAYALVGRSRGRSRTPMSFA